MLVDLAAWAGEGAFTCRQFCCNRPPFIEGRPRQVHVRMLIEGRPRRVKGVLFPEVLCLNAELVSVRS